VSDRPTKLFNTHTLYCIMVQDIEEQLKLAKRKPQETRGRKPLRTPGGQRIRKVVCNMTIPQDLYDFLIENEISRSKLFTEMAKDLYKGIVNPCCFKKGKQETIHGVYCIHCSDDPHRYTWISLKDCACGHRFTVQDRTNEPDYGQVGCYRVDCAIQ